LVRLVIVGTIIFIVHLITMFLLHMLSLSASVFDPAVNISATDAITQVTVVPSMPLAMLLWWSHAAGRVYAGTLSVAKLITSD
jgi:hypothetical protein